MVENNLITAQIKLIDKICDSLDDLLLLTHGNDGFCKVYPENCVQTLKRMRRILTDQKVEQQEGSDENDHEESEQLNLNPIDAKRARSKSLYQRKRNEILEKRKTYYIENKEKVLETNRQYALNNPDKIKSIGKNYYINNREKILENRRVNHQKNKEKEAS